MARFDALLAQNLDVSRKELTAWLRTGRVSHVDGTPIDVRRDPVPDEVLVEGEKVRLYAESHALLHKPLGVVTARSDPKHATAHALLEGAPLWPQLLPVGRLDVDTTGLLLWTTDGALLHTLTHPKTGVPRTYEAALSRAYERPTGEIRLRDGYVPALSDLADIAESDAHPALTRMPDAKVYARVTVASGAYHEVKRLFAALGTHVLSLCRVRYGAVELPHDLPAGAWLPIGRDELTTRKG